MKHVETSSNNEEKTKTNKNEGEKVQKKKSVKKQQQIQTNQLPVKTHSAIENQQQQQQTKQTSKTSFYQIFLPFCLIV